MTSARAETRKAAVLAFIRTFYAGNRYSPTIREIMWGTDCRSTKTVQDYLQKLKTEGLITFKPRKARTVRPVE